MTVAPIGKYVLNFVRRIKVRGDVIDHKGQGLKNFFKSSTLPRGIGRRVEGGPTTRKLVKR